MKKQILSNTKLILGSGVSMAFKRYCEDYNQLSKILIEGK